MSTILEAGLFGVLTSLTFLGALFAVVVHRKSPLPFCVFLLGLGQLGAAFGQRAVADAVERGGKDSLLLLNAGIREAHSNLLLAGGAVVLLVLFQAAMRATER
jgi:hypothetical protein